MVVAWVLNAVELAILGVLIGAACVAVVFAVVVSLLGRCLRRSSAPAGPQNTADA